jgi:hypothetical protein
MTTAGTDSRYGRILRRHVGTSGNALLRCAAGCSDEVAGALGV